MSYVGHGIVLGLTWFLLVDAAVSAATIALARTLAARIGVEHPRRRARLLLGIRTLPAVVAILFVAAAFAPSYVTLEPRSAGEPVDITIGLLAAAGIALIGYSAWRGVDAWRKTSAAARRLIASGAPLCVGARQTRAYAVPMRAPAIFLVGVLRPSLIVTRGLLDLLAPDELSATLRHEASHRRTFDNLQRLAMRCAPDLWSCTRAARDIETMWSAASERAADAAAAAGGRHEALALASALVKVARAAPLMQTLPCASTLVDATDVAWRVRQLVDQPAALTPGVSRRPWLWAASAAVTLAAAFAYGPLLTVVHHATEILVQRLP